MQGGSKTWMHIFPGAEGLGEIVYLCKSSDLINVRAQYAELLEELDLSGTRATFGIRVSQWLELGGKK